MKKKYIILFCILFVGFILRFWNLGKIPSGMTSDEVTYVYNAYSVWHTGRDINGILLPLSINVYNSFSPVPMYLMAPFIGAFGLSLFVARLPFAILGFITIIIIYFIARKLFENEIIALASAFVIAVSPWHIQFSRISYDAIVLFFYAIGIAILLYKKQKGNICWALPAFLLGFYSYNATKIFLLFFIPAFLWIFRKDLLKRKRELWIFCIGIAFIFLSFFLVYRYQGFSRQNILLGNNNSEIIQTVNLERTYSSAQSGLKTIFSNKALVYLRVIRENYLHAFSVDYLFLYGEQGVDEFIWGIGSRGVMYIIELPLLILGVIYVLKNNKQVRNFIFISLLIAPLPSAFTIDQSYGMRSIMMIPFLTILTGCGIYSLLIIIKKHSKFFRYFWTVIFIGVYVFLILSYVYQYQFRYGIYGAEAWLRSKRDISEYVYKVKDRYKQVYVANNGELLMPYAVYNKIDPKVIQAAYESKYPKKIGNVWLIGSCINSHHQTFDPQKYLPPDTLYVVPGDCYKNVTEKPVASIVQVGEPLHTVWDAYERKN